MMTATFSADCPNTEDGSSSAGIRVVTNANAVAFFIPRRLGGRRSSTPGGVSPYADYRRGQNLVQTHRLTELRVAAPSGSVARQPATHCAQNVIQTAEKKLRFDGFVG